MHNVKLKLLQALIQDLFQGGGRTAQKPTCEAELREAQEMLHHFSAI